MYKPESIPENGTHKGFSVFEIQIDHPNLASQPHLDLINKKKRTYLVDLAVPVNHRVKMKVNEMRDKYLNLGRKLKKLWNKVLVIPIVTDMLGTVPKRLEKRLEEKEESRPKESCCHLDTSEIPLADVSVK